MSSHRLSVSGARPYTLQAGGGSATAMQTGSKEDDGFQFTVGNAGRVEIPLFGSVHFEKRKVTSRRAQPAGEPDIVQEHLIDVLVIEGCSNLTVSGWAPELGQPHTNLDVRRPGEKHGPTGYYDEVEVVDRFPLTDQAAQEDLAKMDAEGVSGSAGAFSPDSVIAVYSRLRTTFRFCHLFVSPADEQRTLAMLTALKEDGGEDLRGLTLVAVDPDLAEGEWRMDGAHSPGV